MSKREIIVANDGSYRDGEGKWRLVIGEYELIQHTSDYNAVYLRETGKEVAFRTTWNASLRIMKLLNEAYVLGREHSTRTNRVNG